MDSTPRRQLKADEPSDAPESLIGREFESYFSGGDWVIVIVRH